MSALSGLKLTAAQKPTSVLPVQQRRAKLAKRITEQIELAQAQQEGTTYTGTKLRTVVDSETGIRKVVVANKRVKAWWFVGDNGKIALSVRFGPKVLELAKGKWAVEVGSEKELIPTLELIRSAVIAGDLDSQIENAANKLREGFNK